MRVAALIPPLILAMCAVSCADDGETKAKGLDLVSDTVASVFNKTSALLSGNLEVTMSPEKADTADQYTTNAIGQKVPKSTAIKSAGSLHNDEPL